MSTDEIQKIFSAHPPPWRTHTMVGVVVNGMAEINVFDRNNNVVQLFTLLNLAVLVSTRAALNTASAAPT